MEHPDVDALAMLALGEEAPAAVTAHLAECAACSAELASLRRTVELLELSDFGAGTPLADEGVWAGIATELGPELRAASPSPPTVAAPGHVAGPGGTTTPAHVDGSAQVVRLPPSRSRHRSASPARPRWLIAAAAVVVGAALGAGAVLVARPGADDAAVTIEATAPLAPVDGGPLTAGGQFGEVELLGTSGGPEVRVTASGLPDTGHAYEVWLFGGEGRMVSLGTLRDGKGTFVVPVGIDPAQYRTVDISDEAPDGDPAHSGVSVVRGSFA